MWSVAQRRQTPEIMDDPALEPRRLDRALRAIARLNLAAASARLVVKPVLRLARAVPDGPLRVLDVATGAGDVPIALLRRAHRAGVAIHVDACDCSPVSVEHAQRRARAAQVAMRVFPLDVVREHIPGGYDVLTASLFLHHLQPTDAIRVLRKMLLAARRMVIVSDLRRSQLGYALAWVASRALTRSDVVRVDALRSVQAAYTIDEMRDLAQAAGLHGADVRRRWPQRLVLLWNRTS